ncbi:LPS export ABC transporter periplasmic protein LptC [Odoribacter sp. OttesenSCG-928-L07]|nr:LPS export ABC transporter periplasmic protein LptC [Odoribacter sp. OttesenSCG-928-L07]MDL2239701.1 LPS export ABC transporter periplasmic protein LptC [Bacteroidales bacterium OttesenSCG-928-L14]MDL2240808.1 LPS export ABC transporter periplasmic protein LptC [Bacteroidales bacterium OttesenSCG-928-K22]
MLTINHIKRRYLTNLRFCVFITAVLMTSCIDQTVIDKAKEYNEIRDTLPTETIFNFKISYSENGNIKFILEGEKAINWAHKKEMEFPEGFFVTFYEPDMSKRSTLRADYGINNEEKKIMIANDNVVLVNFKTEEVLNTDELIWDQNKKLIYSEKFVKITTKDDVIYGNKGFESDETFDVWTIKKPSGDFLINEDE